MHSMSGVSSIGFMDSAILLSSIQRIVDENNSLKKDLENKTSNLQKLNEKICDLLAKQTLPNTSSSDQQNTQQLEQLLMSETRLKRDITILNEDCDRYRAKNEDLSEENHRLRQTVKELRTEVESRPIDSRESKLEFKSQLKRAMNDVFRKFNAQMDENRSYSSDEIVDIVSNSIKSATLAVIDSQTNSHTNSPFRRPVDEIDKNQSFQQNTTPFDETNIKPMRGSSVERDVSKPPVPMRKTIDGQQNNKTMDYKTEMCPSLEIRRRRTQIALQVIDIGLNEFATNGRSTQTFMGFISMTTSEGVTLHFELIQNGRNGSNDDIHGAAALRAPRIGHSLDECLKVVQRCDRKTLATFAAFGGHRYEIIEPYECRAVQRVLLPDIERPDYADSGQPSKQYNRIKTGPELAAIFKSCKIAKTILTDVGHRLTAGITGEDIDDMVLCQTYKCYPSPLNYKGFPKCVTTSVNNVAVHGIPDKRPLVDGDIITVDVSVYFNGFHGDCAHTFIVGNESAADPQSQHLLNVAQLCLFEAIKICRDGQKLSTIGETIEKTAKGYGFHVIREFCGHGIGSNLHEPPQVLHYKSDSVETLKENMCITIEPVITEGHPEVAIDGTDGWTVYTDDNCRTAQFEHTLYPKRMHLHRKNGGGGGSGVDRDTSGAYQLSTSMPSLTSSYLYHTSSLTDSGAGDAALSAALNAAKRAVGVSGKSSSTSPSNIYLAQTQTNGKSTQQMVNHVMDDMDYSDMDLNLRELDLERLRDSLLDDNDLLIVSTRSSHNKTPSLTAKDLDKLMLKLDQDNRILAELDRKLKHVTTSGLIESTAHIYPLSSSLPSLNTASHHMMRSSLLTDRNMSSTLMGSMGGLVGSALQSKTTPLAALNVMTTGQGLNGQHSSSVSQQQLYHFLHSSQTPFQQQLDELKLAEDIVDSIEIPNRGRCKVYIARYSYDPFKQSPNDNPEAELTLLAGDFVLIFGNVDEDGFFYGELLDGRRGLIPSNFVEKLTGEDLFEFQASVLYGNNRDSESDTASCYPPEFYDAILNEQMCHSNFQHLLAPVLVMDCYSIHDTNTYDK
ncbi:unnamed protein product, partial [Medioppia subpectinata]